jgi:endonuclease/exonuclease/phosphatase family metal-dependent hydrolase
MSKHYFFTLLFSFFLCSFFFNTAIAQPDSISTNNEKLKILTWNLYMRPRLAFHNGQIKRAAAIVEQLKDQNVDVIVFQETFDNKARNIIWQGLKGNFPYQSGDPRHKHFYKVSTGIFIISKLPLEVIDNIYFSVCGGSDCFAVKGAVLVDVIKNNHKVQIIGTHLQAADGKKMTGEKIRQIQYEEIKNQLMIPHAEVGVPQFFVGDLNTDKEDKIVYEQLLTAMDVQDGEITGDDQFSSGGGKNDLRSANDKPHLIDYILCRSNGCKVSFTQRCVKIFQQHWSKDNKDLSDHYAVFAEIALK